MCLPCSIEQKEVNMRSFVFSLGLALGALGLSLAAPTQVRAEEFRGHAFGRAYRPAANHWRGDRDWRGGRAFYPRYGYNRGFYPYSGYGALPYGVYGGYGTYNRYYNPGVYGRGYYNRGHRYGVRPYGNFYYTPGLFW